MKKIQGVLERRTKARRKRNDRRQMIRWETGKVDRRSQLGQRKEDRAQDSIRSVYELSPPTRRIPLGREEGSTSKPLRVERRADIRRMTDVKVFTHDGVDICKCRLLDISLEGAFIETKSFALRKGANVELVVKIRVKGKPTYCRLPAKVVRADIAGAALKFDHLDEDVRRILRRIVKSSKRKPDLKIVSRS